MFGCCVFFADMYKIVASGRHLSILGYYDTAKHLGWLECSTSSYEFQISQWLVCSSGKMFSLGRCWTVL